jgi:hypothetical protein
MNLTTDRAAWRTEFITELHLLRPHLSDRFCSMLADIHYAEGKDPAAAAQAYHRLQLDQLAARAQPAARH